MRPVGKPLAAQGARRFSHRLHQSGIEHRIEPAGSTTGNWQVWVVDENQIGSARACWESLACGNQLDAAQEPGGLFAPSPNWGGSRPVSFEKTWRTSRFRVSLAPLTTAICALCFTCTATAWWGSLPERPSDAQTTIHTANPALSERAIPLTHRLRQSLSSTLVQANAPQLALQIYWLAVLLGEIERRAGTLRAGMLFCLATALGQTTQILAVGEFARGALAAICACLSFCGERRRRFPWEGYRPTSWIRYYLLWQLAIGAILHAALAATSPPDARWIETGRALPVFYSLAGLLTGVAIARLSSMGRDS